MAPSQPEPERFSGRRVALVTALLIILGALAYLTLWRSLAGALSLTGAGLVAIINFRWLEGLLNAVIQPGEPRFERRSVIRLLGRLLLFAAALAALAWVPSVDAVAAAIGFSTLVVALVLEGVWWGRKAGGQRA